MKTLLFPVFLVAFVLIIQALDQSYQRKSGYLKLLNIPNLCNKKCPDISGAFPLSSRILSK